VSDRIDLHRYFASADEAEQVARFAETIAEETLATTIAVRSAESFGEGFTDLEALAAVHGTGGAFRSLVREGLYANTGDVLVEVGRQGEGIDV
jgi:hypothetical protein